MPFLSKTATQQVATGGGGNYLNPGKLQSGGSFRFALLTDEPLEMFEVWGETAEGKSKPFRFLEEPTPEDIAAEFGPDYDRRENRFGEGLEPVKFVIACPVFSYESNSVAILSLAQKTLIRELDSISQEPDFENLMDWDFSISKEGSGLTTEYKIRPLPAKADRAELKDTYRKAVADGFDIRQLISGGNPFPPSK